MSNDNDIEQRLFKVISEALQKPIEAISGNKKLFIDFNIESVEALELEFAIEEEFNVKIDEKSLWKIPSYLTNQGMVENGDYNNEARTMIQKAFPLVMEDTIKNIKTANDIYKEITVQDIVYFLEEDSK